MGKDVLVQEDLDEIRSRLKTQSRFGTYQEFSGDPESTEEGQKILFSDGDQVRAESTITNLEKGEIRFDPLLPVNRPHPDKEPKKRRLKYVDASQCGRYQIKFHGVTHSYETFHSLIKGVLKNREKARNRFDELKHTIWVEVQDLNLNLKEDFQDRIEASTIKTVRNEIQVKNCAYPPTDPEVLKMRYSTYTKSRRLYDGFQDYVEEAAEFYRGNREDRIADQLENNFTFRSTKDRKDEIKKLVVEKATDRSYS